MAQVPKSMRLQIALLGRVNAGKSTLLNLLAGQDVAITSSVAGTTTDVVEKPMELLPIGPVLLLDTAGLDDTGILGTLRVEKTRKVLDRADVMIIICQNNIWGDPEESVIVAAQERKTSVLAVLNKCDLTPQTPEFLDFLQSKTGHQAITVCALDKDGRDAFLDNLKTRLLEVCPDDFITPPPLVGDLLSPGKTIIMMIPLDKQAPKGRIILPQENVLRDALDHGAIPLVCRDTELAMALDKLKTPPVLAIGDSQAIDVLVSSVPPSVPTTTFSILFSRLKADITVMSTGAAAIGRLEDGDRILIAEACTHHAQEDDIGRVKIPQLIRQKTGKNLIFETSSGRDFPPESILKNYALILHCGSCMLNRRETLRRLQLASNAGVPISNYGMAISFCRNHLERVLSPFPEALQAYQDALKN